MVVFKFVINRMYKLAPRELRKRENRKKYCLEHKDDSRRRSKIYKERNPQLFREKANKRARERLKTDLDFKLKNVYRSRIHEALKKNKKCDFAENLLGCSIPALKNHLEQQFRPGMSWKNYGKEWHLDHIIPCASFDLSIPEHQKECFNYKNLQPLWWPENLAKHGSLKPVEYIEIEFKDNILNSKPL